MILSRLQSTRWDKEIVKRCMRTVDSLNFSGSRFESHPNSLQRAGDTKETKNETKKRTICKTACRQVLPLCVAPPALLLLLLLSLLFHFFPIRFAAALFLISSLSFTVLQLTSSLSSELWHVLPTILTLWYFVGFFYPLSCWSPFWLCFMTIRSSLAGYSDFFFSIWCWWWKALFELEVACLRFDSFHTL